MIIVIQSGPGCFAEVVHQMIEVVAIGWGMEMTSHSADCVDKYWRTEAICLEVPVTLHKATFVE